jgi:nucleotide-binding universal stress UspA family protein
MATLQQQIAGAHARYMKVPVSTLVPLPDSLEAEVDFIAMTTHSRDGLGQFPFDSVAEAVLRGADIPVLMVPSVERSLAARTDHARELKAGAGVA